MIPAARLIIQLTHLVQGAHPGAQMQPNSTLEKVQDYISDARTLLLDTVSPYRYDDASLLVALNVTMLEARRVRPDLFVYLNDGTIPAFSAVDDTDVDVEPQFRLAFVYGLSAHAMTRDQEDIQDSRANSFMDNFYFILTGNRIRQITGGSPQAAGQPR